MSDRRIHETIETLLEGIFSIDLFSEQNPLSPADLKTILSRQISSTSIKLTASSALSSGSASSLDKLFDLVLMSAKSQVLRCACPEQLVQLVLNHVDQCLGFLDADRPTLLGIIRVYIGKLKTHFATLSPYQWTRMRAAILNSLLGFKVKIAVLLKEGHQEELSGDLLSDSLGFCAPGTAELPGTVTRFQPTKTVERFAVHGDWTLTSPEIPKFAVHCIYTNLGLSVFPQLEVRMGGFLPRKIPDSKPKNVTINSLPSSSNMNDLGRGLDILAASLRPDVGAPVEKAKAVTFMDEELTFTEAKIERVQLSDFFKPAPTVAAPSGDFTGDDLLDMMDQLDSN